MNTMPMGVASAMTGLPIKKGKSTRRGRKPSGKPGASHLAALQQAHGAGNYAQAKTHALNYAKAVHQSMGQPTVGPSDDDGDEGMDMPAMPTMAAPAVPAAPKAAAPNPRARLASLAMRRQKPPAMA